MSTGTPMKDAKPPKSGQLLEINKNPIDSGVAEALGPLPDNNAVMRRRREVRAARDKLSEQFDQLRKVLPGVSPGIELSGKAQVLEHSINVIEQLMERATFLAVELAVSSPEETCRWVRNTSAHGRRPLFHTIVSVMKLFSLRKDWGYAEWWTLDEQKNSHPINTNANQMDGRNINYFDNTMRWNSADFETGHETGLAHNMEQSKVVDDDVQFRDEDYDESSFSDWLFDDSKPAGVLEDPGNIHGCVVRDSESVMRLVWTLVHRSHKRKRSTSGSEPSGTGTAADRIEFARQSQQFEFRPRVGMPGRVWTSRRPEWLSNLKDSEVFIRSPLAKRFGMSSCLAVPVQFGGQVHSVMAFFSQEERSYDPDSYDLACLLSRCVEDVHSSNRCGPWITNTDSLFPTQTN